MTYSDTSPAYKAVAIVGKTLFIKSMGRIGGAAPNPNKLSVDISKWFQKFIYGPTFPNKK
jgi:hypothetical protein